MTKLARGIRNNNPLNIRKGIRWQGLATPDNDGAFAVFQSMEWGARAALVLLRNYVKGTNSSKRKYDTLEAIINRWAPECENNTRAYIQRVSSSTGIPARAKIDYHDRSTMTKIACAMADVECGQPMEISIFESAWDMI